MNNIFEQVLNTVQSVFNSFSVRVEEVPESPCTRLVSVYGVPRSRVNEVKQLIRRLDWDLCVPAECGVLAHVVDEETTMEYYPEFVVIEEVNNGAEFVYSSAANLSIEAGKWIGGARPRVDDSSLELALAA
jgi:hypothetical protein